MDKRDKFIKIEYTAEIKRKTSIHKNIVEKFMTLMKESNVAILSVFILVLIILIVLAAPLSPYDPDKMDVASKLLPPGKAHLFGTDSLGRDCFTRVLYGGRVSLQVGFFSMLVSTVFGTIWGTISGYIGGYTDIFMMRIIDIMMSIPSFLLLIILNAFIAPGLITMILIISLFAWMGVARIVRAETMSLKERDFILAAKCLGETKTKIILRHIIPNVFPTIIVSASISIANAILTESSLSFLGFGIQMPMSSWGNMLQGAQSHLLDRPYLAIFPGAFILTTVLSFNVLGDVLRKAFEAE